MRILHVTPYWSEAWAYGGIPRIVGAITRELAAAGHEVTVCATDACSRDARLRVPSAPDGVDLRIFRNRSNRLAYDWQFFTPVGLNHYLRDRGHEFDIAHLHACRNWPGALAAHYLHRYGVPYLVAPNGTAPVIERRRLAKRVFDLAIGRRVIDAAAGFIAVTDAERRQLLSLGVDDQRVHVVPNPVDLPELVDPPARGTFRTRWGLGSERLVLFLGKITPRKRLDVLVRAFARTQQTKLAIAGNDMGGLRTALSQARELGIADRVSTTGLLTGAERLAALIDADVVVYPGEHEIFGLVPLEALLVGTPVVVANDSGCGEILGRIGGGLVTPAGDERAVAAAIERVFANRTEWRRAAARAGEAVRRDFSGASVASRLAAVYARVAGYPHGRASIAPAVSYVVPVRNGISSIARTIASVELDSAGRPAEIVAVDDRSADGSHEWLAAQAAAGRLRLLEGSGRGVSAALNLGIRAARHPYICQVDQDVEILPGWTDRLVAALEAGSLGAVQGQFTVDPESPLLSRVMALDLEQRYESLGAETNHVCTGNTMYRARALQDAGGFDESLGYGNDNDMSARLGRAGWRLGHCRQARSFHRWRTSLPGYLRQQYGFGYGRVEFVGRDPGRVAGDDVSGLMMMAHAPVFLLAIAALASAAAAVALGASFQWPLGLAAGLFGALIAERSIAGIRAWIRFGHRAALLFPVIHLLRDAAWSAAVIVWSFRRVLGRPPAPADSMKPRASPNPDRVAPKRFVPRACRTMGIIPAHNEAATLASVIAGVRRCQPDLDLLVVDDGSTDDCAGIAARAGVRWLRLAERMGVGSAMRAGLSYARRLGYDSAIRIDADGQHGPADIERMLEPVRLGRFDAVQGSRFLGAADGSRAHSRRVRAAQRGLALCLSLLTRARVTDPTSGFYAFGPRAMALLAREHPTGYPEPEMRLLLRRNTLSVVEVAIESRPRQGGRTSLTLPRLVVAGSRVLLAMLIVPFRPDERGGGHA